MPRLPKHVPSALVLLFILSSGLLCLSTAAPDSVTHTLLSRADDTSQAPACGFEGNSDLYGLGIRLGVYFQWLSGFVVFIGLTSGRQALAEAYLAFLFAVLIAALVISKKAAQTHAVEIVLLLYIIYGGIFALLFIPMRASLFRQGKWIEETDGLAFLMNALVMFGAGTFSCWFWFRGLHNEFLGTPCGSHVFLFARVSLYKPPVYRFFRALSVIFTFFSSGQLVGMLFVFVKS